MLPVLRADYRLSQVNKATADRRSALADDENFEQGIRTNETLWCIRVLARRPNRCSDSRGRKRFSRAVISMVSYMVVHDFLVD